MPRPLGRVPQSRLDRRVGLPRSAPLTSPRAMSPVTPATDTRRRERDMSPETQPNKSPSSDSTSTGSSVSSCMQYLSHLLFGMSQVKGDDKDDDEERQQKFSTSRAGSLLSKAWFPYVLTAGYFLLFLAAVTLSFPNVTSFLRNVCWYLAIYVHTLRNSGAIILRQAADMQFVWWSGAFYQIACSSSFSLIAAEPLVFFPETGVKVNLVNAYVVQGDLHLQLWFSSLPSTPATDDSALWRALNDEVVTVGFYPSADKDGDDPIECHPVSPVSKGDAVGRLIAFTCATSVHSLASADDLNEQTGTIMIRNTERLSSPEGGHPNPIPKHVIEPASIRACAWDPDIGHTPLETASAGKLRHALVTLVRLSYHRKEAAHSIRPTEHSLLLEWTQYHLALGISHIFVYVDGERAEAAAVLHEFVNAGLVSVISTRRIEIPSFSIEAGGRVQPRNLKYLHQHVVFSAHVDRYKELFAFQAILDIDEFIYINPELQNEEHDVKENNESLLDSLLVHLSPQWVTSCSTPEFRLRWQYLFALDETPDSAESSAQEVEAPRPPHITSVYRKRGTEVAKPFRSDSKALFDSRAITAYADTHGLQRRNRRDCSTSASDVYVDPVVAHAVHFRARPRNDHQDALEEPVLVNYMHDLSRRIVQAE
ncbi:hypothetical protein FVE85_7302 [Porphyridium purpureum]|uniref:Glycosyltransferase family 92 protein n=1 Tax=Porphyridium purpureum TaxID=35688 RepID=A0A5J4ZAR0_PORPP|nr:hypothetical protein FVE85_7302 [Porphyridium purpureum]|eukprot:POR9136..scf295_1